MKIKLLALLVFCVISGVKTLAQSIEGNWYTPLPNKLLHIVISKDSIVFRKCSFDDMKDYGYADVAFRIAKTVDNTYIVSEKKKNGQEIFYLFGVALENERCLINMASMSDEFLTFAEAEDHYDVLKGHSRNIVLVAKTEVETIKKQRAITTMTTEDFKKFANAMIGLDAANIDVAEKKYKLSYLYRQSILRILLADIGFDPFVATKGFDTLWEFAENPETKDLFAKMSKDSN